MPLPGLGVIEVGAGRLDGEPAAGGGQRLDALEQQILARGRGKSLSGDQKHSPVVQVRVSEHTRDRLRAIAKARGMSVSKRSRKVLDEFVAREALGDPSPRCW
ncbi:MAG: hypothetical protein QJR12_00015 [Mycobacterium sp.]|uniref:hypothetical protein n=1 Tax=Mycobacterium sp. TaxID=1785 RepID=UPI00261B7AFF|nr:hypothetical protein [Mycobacterium sp.]MDI3312711.1 hypothetical protein [Mycobacterium sp.]